ncbi:hypothetical protein [Acetobacter fallax]|uniref:Uncharacterized protein n=1 Tax=Acetobacter fallax TaxID=1737473 RepID=A0ABX0KA70_9PROT|nr:hypothetical protein [Acetobacter fallax]NHO33304.1 hypothetical protein [Acetobacter fallax]NHO36925.1 hypothetical protein [Acetobacter fallax]
MARVRSDLSTAWVSRDGRIDFQAGVGFPDGKLPLCCGDRDVIKTALKARAWTGSAYAVPGVSADVSDQVAFEAVEKLRVSMVGINDGIISYFSGMNRRDVGCRAEKAA